MGTEDDTSQLVLRLVIKLLKGCSRTFTNNINEDNFNTYLRRLFLSKREEAEEENLEYHFQCRSLLDDGLDFGELSLRNRVKIVHQLCEFRLEAEDVFDKVKNLDASSLRVEPLGKDSEGATYWYFYGTRLYKETAALSAKKKEKKKKKKKDKKKKKKKRRDSTEDDELVQPKWSVVCLTLDDWEKLTEKYKKSTKKCDRELYETLSESFLPEIVKMFAEKEREEKRRMLMMQPKRASSRIERKKQEQEERDRLLAIKLEEERRLEEEYDTRVREERQRREEETKERAREERRAQRDAVKELRAQRAIERDLVRGYAAEHEDQDDDDDERGERKSKKRTVYTETDSDDYEDYNMEEATVKKKRRHEEADAYVPPAGVKPHDSEEEEDLRDSSSDNESDSMLKDDLPLKPKEKKLSRKEKKKRKREKRDKSSFANALLKVGTKSTKDSTLDKPVRRTPGHLLEAAGRSLLQKTTSKQQTAFDRLTSGSNLGLLSSGSGSGIPGSHNSGTTGRNQLSFGLWGGDLRVETNYPKSAGSDSDGGDSLHGAGGGSSAMAGSHLHGDSKLIQGSSNVMKSKVFSNWGGGFFKKNLDYRANTNKILEKMNLGGAGGTGKKDLNGGDGSSSSSSSERGTPTISSGVSPFVPGERFKALLQGGSGSNAPSTSASQQSPFLGLKRPLEQNPSSSTSSKNSKKFKSNSFLNSY